MGKGQPQPPMGGGAGLQMSPPQPMGGGGGLQQYPGMAMGQPLAPAQGMTPAARAALIQSLMRVMQPAAAPAASNLRRAVDSMGTMGMTGVRG